MKTTLISGYLEYMNIMRNNDNSYKYRIKCIKIKVDNIYKLCNLLFNNFIQHLSRSNYKFRHYSVNNWLTNQESARIYWNKVKSYLNLKNKIDLSFYMYNNFMYKNFPQYFGDCIYKMHNSKIPYNIYELYNYLLV